jgi:membrane-associated protease RseP (regulator of RpoE activity)
MLSTILTIIVVVVGILGSVGLHELGHFFPAKLFKVPVSQYFIGFGPTIWSTKKGETEYGVKAVPLGGFCRIEGMFGPAHPGHVDKYFKDTVQGAREESLEGMEGFEESRAFYYLSSPKKLLVMMGGTLTNLVLGGICFIVAFTLIGTPAASQTLSAVADGGPASQVEITAGDTITGINGDEMHSWADVVTAIRDSETNEITVTFEHNTSAGEQGSDRTETRTETVKADGEKGAFKLGITAGSEYRQISLLDSLAMTGSTTLQTLQMIVKIPGALFDSVKLLIFGGDRDPNGLVSVIGVGQIAVQSDQLIEDPLMKVANMLSLIGSLNIALFVFNLIPLLPLDGGHSANAIYEGVVRLIARLRKKTRPLPSDLARTMPIGYLVWLLLIGMFIITALVDILHPLQL